MHAPRWPRPPRIRRGRGRRRASAPSSSAWARRRSAKHAPWTIPKSACPAGRGAASARRAQRVVRATASSTTARGESPGGHTSSCIWMSAPRRPWTRTASSGDRACKEPSRCDLKVNPSSVAPTSEGPPTAQRVRLEAARVGQHRVGPPRERVQPAEPRDALGAGPQHEVVRVAEDDAGSGGRHLAGRQRLDAALGADGHEGGSLDVAVGRRQERAAGVAVASEDAEGEARGGRGQTCLRSSMASP